MPERPGFSVEELYRIHGRELLRFAASIAGPSDAQDVVAEVFLALVQNGTPDLEAPQAFLRTATINAAKSLHRSSVRRRQRMARFLAGGLSTSGAEPEPGAEAGLLRALGSLTVQQRIFVYLTYWDDLQPATVASISGVSEGTVRKQLARARHKIRRALDE